MPNAPKREKRENKLPVKEEIGGESTAKPVFQIKPPPQKKLWTQILGNRQWRCREKSMRWRCDGNGDSDGSDGGERNWVFGFDFRGRKGWVLS